MVTPARRQYLTLKEQYPDAILFFQIGDFYETFDDDAKIVARDAEVHLTSKDFGRDGRVPLAGVPVRALDTYLRKLLGERAPCRRLRAGQRGGARAGRARDHADRHAGDADRAATAARAREYLSGGGQLRAR